MPFLPSFVKSSFRFPFPFLTLNLESLCRDLVSSLLFIRGVLRKAVKLCVWRKVFEQLKAKLQDESVKVNYNSLLIFQSLLFIVF